MAGTTTAMYSEPRAESMPSTSGPTPPRTVVSMRFANIRAPCSSRIRVASRTLPKATPADSGRESVLTIAAALSGRGVVATYEGSKNTVAGTPSRAMSAPTVVPPVRSSATIPTFAMSRHLLVQGSSSQIRPGSRWRPRPWARAAPR